jgi:hypothetical protein
MTDGNSPRFIVARYLQDQGYHQVCMTRSIAPTEILIYKTLQSFLSEANLPPAATETKPGDWVLEEIIKEKSLYDQNLNYEKDDTTVKSGWSEPSPSKPIQPPGAYHANGLAVAADSGSNTILASFVNNIVAIWDTACPPESTLGILPTGKNILSFDIVKDRFFLCGYMDGSVAIHDMETFKSLASVKAHGNYAVQVISTWDGTNLLIATAGWDKKLSIHCPEFLGDGSYATFPQSFLSIPTRANVQSLLFARHPDTDALYLIYTIRDSIHLHYLHLTPSPASPTTSTTSTSFPYTATPSGTQSLAPHQHSTWTSFTPSFITSHPTDPTLIAIATSHTPTMKLIIVRLLFPSPPGPSPSPRPTHQAATPLPHSSHMTKDELAIKLVVSTSAPQNDYSTPRCAWRPDGSGVWVSGDDGVVRGIDAETGKVVSQLKGGHEMGTKIRGLWAGMLGRRGGSSGEGAEKEREVCISAGFDRRVLVWEC